MSLSPAPFVSGRRRPGPAGPDARPVRRASRTSPSRARSPSRSSWPRPRTSPPERPTTLTWEVAGADRSRSTTAWARSTAKGTRAGPPRVDDELQPRGAVGLVAGDGDGPGRVAPGSMPVAVAFDRPVARPRRPSPSPSPSSVAIPVAVSHSRRLSEPHAVPVTPLRRPVPSPTPTPGDVRRPGHRGRQLQRDDRASDGRWRAASASRSTRSP